MTSTKKKNMLNTDLWNPVLSSTYEMEHSLILINEPKEWAAIKHNTVSVVLELILQHKIKNFLRTYCANGKKRTGCSLKKGLYGGGAAVFWDTHPCLSSWRKAQHRPQGMRSESGQDRSMGDMTTKNLWNLFPGRCRRVCAR